MNKLFVDVFDKAKKAVTDDAAKVKEPEKPEEPPKEPAATET